MADDRTNNIRWGVLLSLLVAAFLVGPLFGTSVPSELATLVLVALSVTGTIFASAVRTGQQRLAGAFIFFWFTSGLLAIADISLRSVVAAISLVMVFGALLMTFRMLQRQGRGDVDTLLGAIFGYLLLAMAWAMLYMQIERWQPGSFRAADGSDALASMLYFSLVTLTTLGYGDVIPANPVAQVAAGFEAVVGVLYIAVMVGRIVASLGAFRR